MVDTVRFKVDCAIRPGKLRKTNGIWEIPQKKVVKAVLKRGRVVAVEVSLPTLLFGTNGTLIENQRQLDRALAETETALQTIAGPSKVQRSFTRVDLAWHFLSAPPENFFLAHQFTNHSYAQTKMFVYRDFHRLITGVRWEGNQLVIHMYDKTLPKTPTAQQIVRVEIQLRGKRLKKFMANGRPVKGLNLTDCYRVFRSILLKFRPKPVPQIKSKDEALCYAEKKRVPVFRLLANSGLSNKQIGRLRNIFTTYFFREFKVDWQKLLPQAKLPPVHNADKLRSPVKYKFRGKSKSLKVKYRFRSHP
jgi:hypothetical protein